jgi:predicted RNase H-like nuclease (RuvC/YqgF family)
VNPTDTSVQAAVNLESIDRKIHLVVEKVERLASENVELKSLLKSTEQEKNTLARKIEQIVKELESSRGKTRDLEKEEAIRKKIHSLLRKLEQM